MSSPLQILIMTKPFSPASARNREPILDVLRRHFADRQHVLEIGAGTGQHAVHFAAAMPWLQWQASDHADHLPGMQQWLDEAALPNTPQPIVLQAVLTPTAGLAPLPALPVLPDGQRGFDAIYSANTLHIMGWPQVQALFAGLPAVMAPQAVLAVYGPFNRNGQFTSDSNRAFDAMLRERDPASGIRDADAVDALATAAGLQLIDDVALPANNHCRVWRRG
ncbi:class I SAM-dependent methyltransferase [Xanthomonas cannabis]|uniref:DUF938 domain-containing protein n=1 Tax=Xanthomonas cannabis TaxID=1885674 RepID=UPI001E30E8B4|nr:DUF938 domain-containing protein [Xanthomonas cannabis]MCC8442458.1 class I SAM-dependent methyltransferase [Xanthomonas cannabis]